MYWVYILESINTKKYYVGCSNNYIRRFHEHQNGESASTKWLRPFKLVLAQSYESLGEARQVESRIKNFKRKDYIKKMIDDGYIKMNVLK